MKVSIKKGPNLSASIQPINGATLDPRIIPKKKTVNGIVDKIKEA